MIVTERGNPIALIQPIKTAEKAVSLEARLARLAAQGFVALPHCGRLPMIYLDTSALLKRFVGEKGSALVESLVRGKGAIATAKIAYAEIFAGFTRKLHKGNLSKPQYAVACRQFERDWHAYLRVGLEEDILLFLARDLIQRHPLRGYDAVHLASALRLKIALGEEITFAAADGDYLRPRRLKNFSFSTSKQPLFS